MLWKTHLRIGKEVLRLLGITLSNEVASKFEDGLFTPDSQKDHEQNCSKIAEIRRSLMQARKSFLQDDLSYTYHYLGIALHYIQDSYTSVANFDTEQSWGEKIEASQFVNDIEKTIRHHLKGNSLQMKWFLTLARALSKSVQGRENTLRVATLTSHEAIQSSTAPIIDLNLALEASLVVTESVLSPKAFPAIEIKLEDVLAQYEILLKNAEIEASNSLIKLIEEKDQILNIKVPPKGAISKIKNRIVDARASQKNKLVLYKYIDYVSKCHLHNIVNQYNLKVREIVAPYDGWYNYRVLPINMNTVCRNLLAVQEVGENLGLDEVSANELLEKNNVPILRVRNNELIKRTDLKRIITCFTADASNNSCRRLTFLGVPLRSSKRK
jgi:hypothetical protein